MEQGNDIVTRNAPSPPKGEGKKKQGFFKAALVMLRNNKQNEQKLKETNPKTETVEAPNAKDNWKKIVGSIRPLHIPNTTSPTDVPKRKHLRAVRSVDNFDDIYLPPPSPTYSTASSSSGMSQYASAVDLRELEKQHGGGHDYEVNDAFFDEHSADVMIDKKAEEFISRFYEQMRRQMNLSRKTTE